MRIRKGFVALLVWSSMAASVQAHHSSLVSSTSERTMVQGTITRVEWVNPHVQIYLNAKDPATGDIVPWRVEAESAANLKAKGITLESLKFGAMITAKGVERIGHRPRIMEVSEPDASWKN